MHKNPLIIISDADFDDLIAIAWLTLCPEVDIKLIIYSCNGWSNPPIGAENIAHMLKLSSQPNIPVHIGSETRLSDDDISIPDNLRQASDELWGINFDKSGPIEIFYNAANNIVQAIHESEQDVDILVIGPLTDLALALERDQSISEKINHVTLMGGAPFLSCEHDNFAGNCRLDIRATLAVYQQSFPIRCISKSVNKNFPLGNAKFKLFNNAKNSLVHFVFQISQAMYQRQLKLNAHKKLYLWDVVAAFACIFGEHYCLIESIDIEFDEHQQDFRKYIQYNVEGREVQHVVDIKNEAFNRLFFERISNHADE